MWRDVFGPPCEVKERGEVLVEVRSQGELVEALKALSGGLSIYSSVAQRTMERRQPALALQLVALQQLLRSCQPRRC